MPPKRTIFDQIFKCSMHLNRIFLLLQKDAAKEVYKDPLEHSVYMGVLSQIYKYGGMYPVPVYVYKYEGNCCCESAVAKIRMLRNKKNNFIAFKETCVLVIHRKFDKQRCTSAKKPAVIRKK